MSNQEIYPVEVGPNYDDYDTKIVEVNPPQEDAETLLQNALEYLRPRASRIVNLVSYEYAGAVDMLNEQPEVAQALIDLANYLKNDPELQKGKF